MKDHSQDPTFIKRAEEADALLLETGLPEGVKLRNGILVVIEPPAKKKK